MTSTPTTRYLSVAQAAEAAGLSTKTIRRQIAAGHLPARRIGRVIRIREADLANLGTPLAVVR